MTDYWRNDEEYSSVKMPRSALRNTHELPSDSTPGLRDEEQPSD
jgi:hypothetical protein